jgi:hypothetical protein
MPSLLGAMGKRVTIRLHEPSGGYRDIVGILQSERHLINSKSETIYFSPDEIAIWREIKPLPDLAGKGAPLSQRIMELEKLSDLTWPAEKIVDYGKWRLRISDGFTMRANSTLPLGAGPIGEPPIDLEGAVEAVINIYRENKLTPTFAIPLPIYEELDQYLDRTGWSLKLAGNFLIRDIGESEFAGNDEFTYEYGTNEYIKHKPTMVGARGNLTAVYAIAKIEGIEPLFVVVHKPELDRIQKLSKSGGSSYSPYNNGTDVFNVMQSKVAIKLLFKTLPKTDNEALIKVLELDNKFDYQKNVKIVGEETGYDIIEEEQKVNALEEKPMEELKIETTESFKELSKKTK